MFNLNGKHGEASIFTDNIEASAISQIQSILNQPFCENNKVCIMPDVHTGSTCPIGTTITIKDCVVPNMVSGDIGCGLDVAILKEKHFEWEKLDKFIKAKIPFGAEVRKTNHRYVDDINLNELHCLKHINLLRAEKSLGSLGGGNHFIEIDKDDDGHLYVVVHSGSRHLGLEVARYYQSLAYATLNGTSDEDIEKLTKELKAAGKNSSTISKEISTYKNTKHTNIPQHFAYLTGSLFNLYMHDMKIVQQFAALNRRAIVDDIVKEMKFHVVDRLTTIHNYVNTEDMILRKGAVSAKAGEKLIIPINMRDGALLCTGKGNPDWNYSAPHGAGRLMNRADAKQSFTLAEYKEAMKGIKSSTINMSTLDECPMAYKSIDEIIANIQDTVSIDKIIKPVYNFKAADTD